MTPQALITGVFALAGVGAAGCAVLNERRMQQHRQPGITYAAATFRRDGGWRRAELFTARGLEYQVQASRFGIAAVVLWICALLSWVLLADSIGQATIWFFEIAAEASPLVLAAPIVWGVFALFAVLALVATRIRPLSPEQRNPNPLPLLLLLGVPVLIVVLAMWQQDAKAGKTEGFFWQDGVLLFLVVSQIALGAWLVRRLKHRLLALLVGLLLLWYAIGAVLVAGMSISNVWL